MIAKFFLEDIKLYIDNFKDIKNYKKLCVEKGEININLCTKFMNLINRCYSKNAGQKDLPFCEKKITDKNPIIIIF